MFGRLNGVPTVCMKGRIHPYEGFLAPKCALPVRLMKLMGIEILIVTNAAGSTNPEFDVGDFMIIKDHISWASLSGESPLRGPNEEKWGPRFVSMQRAYCPNLIRLTKKVAKDLKLESIVKEGIYCQVSGPSYETVAELRALKLLGADAVGMSTTYEVITARHCNIPVLGLSLITNKCTLDWDCDEEPDHKNVLIAANNRSKDMEALISQLVSELSFETNGQDAGCNRKEEKSKSLEIKSEKAYDLNGNKCELNQQAHYGEIKKIKNGPLDIINYTKK